jgi:hypothetical protein
VGERRFAKVYMELPVHLRPAAMHRVAPDINSMHAGRFRRFGRSRPQHACIALEDELSGALFLNFNFF